MKLVQEPAAGRHILAHRGDVMEFRLEGDAPLHGKAFLRTNIGNASVKRSETISRVECGGASDGQDWHDIPMCRTEDGSAFSVRLALVETGHFEAKCCLFPDDDHEPLWPEGENAHINVEPAGYCCANSIYCAFVRQFGINKGKASSSLPDDVSPAALKALDDRQFAVIPPSGTFRDLIKELDHITGTLKCRILHLLPINPTPTVYGRMGRYGSPYAALDFTAVDPSLAEFDRKATPLDQFQELVDAVHLRDARIFIDIAINHTGWAAKLHETHPEWLVREPDGTIHSPGAWGVVWGDLTELDHRRLELWKYLAEVFLTWCAHGVDGFRCDAGYMIPFPAWNYIISRVREEYPDTVFLLEGLGGDPAITTRLLDEGNMNWAYSELFQNYSREEVERYISYAWKASEGDGLMVHYAETHDNARLAAVSKKYAAMRTALCALLSSNGAFGFASGVEWFAEEKIDVHESSALNWGAKLNQVSAIARLNAILASHPAFHAGGVTEIIDSGCPTAVIALRSDASYKRHLLIAVNLNCGKGASPSWDPASMPFDSQPLHDLISERRISPSRRSNMRIGMALAPGQALCLSPSRKDIDMVQDAEAKDALPPERLRRQEAKAMALSILCERNRTPVMPETDAEKLADTLLKSPETFVESLFCDNGQPCVRWAWPEDLNRELMLPPESCLLVESPMRFRAALSIDGKTLRQLDSLQDSKGSFFTIFPPLPPCGRHKPAKLLIAAYSKDSLQRHEAPLLLLAAGVEHTATGISAKELRSSPRTFLQGNGRGAILRPCLDLESLRSRYDAIMLANLSEEHPEDRHIMWRRVRLWTLHHAKSTQFTKDTLESFSIASDGGGVWRHRLPVGSGLHIDVSLKMEILEGENSVRMTICRHAGARGSRCLCDETPVKIIVRPDIEDRNFHSDTKASQGPEKTWPEALSSSERGFEFKPSSNRMLSIQSSKGHYSQSPEWQYMIWHQNESSRGLDDHGDLFSPGYFEISLASDESAAFLGHVATGLEKTPHAILKPAPSDSFKAADGRMESVLLSAMRSFVVKRDKLKTVIAGYPWFLDWGRDTLICARGLVAATEFREDVKKILLQFAMFAEQGTLPNMICGGDACNRDTSDAPLWLFTACNDLCTAEASKDFLNSQVRRGTSLLDVLESTAQGIIDGTPNGIKVDKKSGLVFSPAHFTWMDTNYPAGTPREGYPIEIQALWFAALKFLASSTESQNWAELAEQVRDSIAKLFTMPSGQLSDCLHCSPKTPAAKAIPDDHLRPNQIFAITLGAIPPDSPLCKGILQSCASLLVPGAMRSLADRKVNYLLPIPGRDGSPLNTPSNPYWGRYEGDEDTRRKPAYHNGTAWTWPFPSYCEAWFMVHGEPGRNSAKAILSSSLRLLEEGCLAQIPEILDGDYPHAQRGCDAQAWGVSELYRVWTLLRN